MTDLGPGIDSLFDEKSWGNDAYSFSNSLYKIQPNYISYGTIEDSLDQDRYVLEVQSGNSYEVYLTSDTSNYGWNSNNNGLFIEFDILDSFGSILQSSSPLLVYDDKAQFTADTSG